MVYEQPSITFFGKLHVQFLFFKIVLTSFSSHVHVDASIIILSMSVASIVNQSFSVKSNGISPLAPKILTTNISKIALTNKTSQNTIITQMEDAFVPTKYGMELYNNHVAKSYSK